MKRNNLAEKKRITKYDALFILLLVFMVVFYAWRLPHGYAGIDEGFYYTIPLRLTQGDSLITQEWHVSQLSGILLYPFMVVYRMFGGTGEGIILVFRYFYGAMQIITAVCIYVCLRRKNGERSIAALGATAVFLAYAPHCNTALSYNTMGIMCLTLCGAMLATADHKSYKLVIGGVLYAFAVLCCPYLIVLYIIYTVCLMIKAHKLKHNNDVETAKKQIKAWIIATIGAAMVALVILAVFLANTQIDRLLQSLKQIMADPEHEKMSVLDKIYNYFYLLFFYTYPLYRIYRVPILLGVIYAVGMLFVRAKDTRWREHRIWYLAFIGIYTICIAIMLKGELGYIQRLNLALPIAGLCAYALSEKQEKGVFKYIYLSGIGYSFLIHLGSNTRFNCISSALIVACVASAYMLVCVADELWKAGKKKEKIASGVVILAVLTVCALSGHELAMKSFALFGDKMVDERNMLYCYVDKGSHKGLYIAEDELYDYNALYESTQIAREAEGESVMYYTDMPFVYLMDEKENAAFSAWLSLSRGDSAIDRQLEYWIINPEKVPDVIYIEKKAVGAERAVNELNIANYSVTETETAYLLTR